MVAFDPDRDRRAALAVLWEVAAPTQLRRDVTAELRETGSVRAIDAMSVMDRRIGDNGRPSPDFRLPA